MYMFDNDHSLGGFMQYGTVTKDDQGNIQKVEGVSEDFSPAAAEKVIQGVPRVEDKVSP
jgi:hypothetical protein